MLKILPLNINVRNSYLATILYLKDINNIPGVCVTMYTSIEKAVSLILRDGTVSSSSNVDRGFIIMIW